MEKLQIVLDSIDWLLCGVLIIAGRYWGRKYFKPFKAPRYNFLAFSTLAGIVYVVLGMIDGISFAGRATNLMVTYLVATSFYELLASLIFSKIEQAIPALGRAAGDGDDDLGGPGSNPGGPKNPPPPPPQP